MTRILLRKSDVLAHFKEPVRAAEGLLVSRQAVHQWGRYVPQSTAKYAIRLYPELAAKATNGKAKKRARSARL